MKTYFYEKLSPRALAVIDLCDYYGEGFIITRINVPKEFRNKGVASKLLQRVLDEADKEKINLWLEISASDGLNYDQLEAWYKRHGFKGTTILRRKYSNGN